MKNKEFLPLGTPLASDLLQRPVHVGDLVAYSMKAYGQGTGICFGIAINITKSKNIKVLHLTAEEIYTGTPPTPELSHYPKSAGFGILSLQWSEVIKIDDQMVTLSPACNYLRQIIQDNT